MLCGGRRLDSPSAGRLAAPRPAASATPPSYSAADGNCLGGPLSAQWALPPSLVSLALGGNALTSSIPPGLALPFSLQWFSVYSNRLSGPLPPGWPGAGRQSLQMLELEEKGLTGSISPQWLAELPSSLKSLNVSFNRLTGGGSGLGTDGQQGCRQQAVHAVHAAARRGAALHPSCRLTCAAYAAAALATASAMPPQGPCPAAQPPFRTPR